MACTAPSECPICGHIITSTNPESAVYAVEGHIDIYHHQEDAA